MGFVPNPANFGLDSAESGRRRPHDPRYMSKARNSDTHRGASYVGTRNGLAHIENYHAAHHDATSYGVCNALGLLGPSNGTSSRAAAATATLRHWAAVHRRRGSFSSIPASSSWRATAGGARHDEGANSPKDNEAVLGASPLRVTE